MQALWNESVVMTLQELVHSCKMIRRDFSTYLCLINHWVWRAESSLCGFIPLCFHWHLANFSHKLNAEIPPPPVHLSVRLFKKSPCHLTFHSLPFPADVLRPHLQRAAALPGNVLFPKLHSHQPPTEPHTQHEPRLSGTEQMYHDTHIVHVQRRGANTHTRQSMSHRPISQQQRAGKCSRFQCHLSNHTLKSQCAVCPQLVEFQRQHLSIILMSCLLWNSPRLRWASSCHRRWESRWRVHNQFTIKET